MASLLDDGTFEGARTEWSYSLKISDGLIGEIRSTALNSRINVRIWAARGPMTAQRASARELQAAQFLEDLDRAVEENLHLFDEGQALADARERLPDVVPGHAITNVYSETYAGAERLFSLAERIDKPKKPRLLNWDGALPASGRGSLYLASAMFFVVSLEAFVNALYLLLLKSEFKDPRYERLTIRSDLDLRVISLQIFCDGFARQPVSPGSELLARLLSLREFRNDYFHGNTTDEHRTHALPEDGFLFFYKPGSDFRGRKRERPESDSIPRVLGRMRGKAVRQIKATVDDLVRATIDAMDEPHRKWAGAWLGQGLIGPSPGAQERSKTTRS